MTKDEYRKIVDIFCEAYYEEREVYIDDYPYTVDNCLSCPFGNVKIKDQLSCCTYYFDNNDDVDKTIRSVYRLADREQKTILASAGYRPSVLI